MREVPTRRREEGGTRDARSGCAPLVLAWGSFFLHSLGVNVVSPAHRLPGLCQVPFGRVLSWQRRVGDYERILQQVVRCLPTPLHSPKCPGCSPMGQWLGVRVTWVPYTRITSSSPPLHALTLKFPGSAGSPSPLTR